MKKITLEELLPVREYNNTHTKFLKEVIAEKKVRRIQLNEKMSGLFETRLTIWYQIQEMIRAEQMEREEYLLEMLEVYNDLVPENNELSMTLFIEIPDQEELRSFNKTVVGIEKSVELRFGDHKVTSYEPGDEEENPLYTQSIHYLRFPFDAEQLKAFKAHQGSVTIAVVHPNYHSEETIPAELVESLKKELVSPLD